MGRRWVLFALISACTGSKPDEGHVARVRPSVQQCPDLVVEGVDVYAGTGTIDWTKVKASGRDFAFIKATQGDYNKQSTFAANWTNARAAGVLRSPYHFFDGTIDGVVQANAFLDEVAQAGGLEVGDLPPMLDIECPVSSSQTTATSTDPNCEYTGNSGWVDSTTLGQRIFDWLDTVHAATGTTPIVYSYVSWFASVAVTDPRLAGYPLFIASLNTCASVPAPWTAATFWQYSTTTLVDGIAAAGDVDRFFGSDADLGALTIQPAPPHSDAGVPDAGASAPAGAAGCGCHGAGTPASAGAGILALIAILRRRRHAENLPTDQ